MCRIDARPIIVVITPSPCVGAYKRCRVDGSIGVSEEPLP